MPGATGEIKRLAIRGLVVFLAEIGNLGALNTPRGFFSLPKFFLDKRTCVVDDRFEIQVERSHAWCPKTTIIRSQNVRKLYLI